MKMKNNVYKVIIFSLLLGFVFLISKNNSYEIRSKIQNNLISIWKSTRVIDELDNKVVDGIDVSIKKPKLICSNKKVGDYINSYINNDINNIIINENRDIKENKVNIDKFIIDYKVKYMDKDIINIIIYLKEYDESNKLCTNRQSYVFDLKTGQRVYLDKFLELNKSYNKVIEEYILDTIGNDKRYNKEIIVIDKYTNYYISDNGICVFFNIKDEDNIKYEFKIPHNIFKNKIKVVETKDIGFKIKTKKKVENTDYLESNINIPVIDTNNKFINSCNDIIENDVMTKYNKFKEEAKNYLENEIYIDKKFVFNTNFEVKKNTNNVLSIIITYYTYSGGAHGYYENESYNISVDNEKILNLEDLFYEDYDYENVINEEIRKQIVDLEKKDKENIGVYQFEGIDKNQKFYIEDNNLIIYFDLYEIGPYALGIPEFKIKCSTISHMLKKEYINLFN